MAPRGATADGPDTSDGSWQASETKLNFSQDDPWRRRRSIPRASCRAGETASGPYRQGQIARALRVTHPAPAPGSCYRGGCAPRRSCSKRVYVSDERPMTLSRSDRATPCRHVVMSYVEGTADSVRSHGTLMTSDFPLVRRSDHGGGVERNIQDVTAFDDSIF